MMKFKTNKGKTVFIKQGLFLIICFFLSLSKVYAGNFTEIPVDNYMGQNYSNTIILQFNDEDYRESGAIIPIGDIQDTVLTLENTIKKTAEKNKNIVAVDFSNSDLTEEHLNYLFDILKKYGILYLDISTTHVELVSDHEIIDVMKTVLPLKIPINNETIKQKPNKKISIHHSLSSKTKLKNKLESKEVGTYIQMLSEENEE